MGATFPGTGRWPGRMTTMHGDRRIAAVLLAVLYTVSGVLCLVAAVWPMRPDSPVAVLGVLGVVGTAGGLALWALGRTSALVGPARGGRCWPASCWRVLAWQSVTAVGVVSLGPADDRPRASSRRTSSTCRRPGCTSPRWPSWPAPVRSRRSRTCPRLQWLTGVVTAVVLAEVQGRLAHNLRTAAATDPLTGIANRRAWEAEADRNLARAAPDR